MSNTSRAAKSASERQPDDQARRLHPATLMLRVLISLPALGAILLPLLLTPGDGQAWSSLLFGVIYGVVALPLIALRYWRFRYWIAGGEIVIQKGVLKTQNRSIPIERIQNIQVVQSLLPRLLGMAKVKIETAGSRSTEGTLEYVALDEAEHIRQVVRTFKRRQEGPAAPPTAPVESEEALRHTEETEAAAAGESIADTQRKELYQMPLRHVLLSGMFRFSLALIAAIFTGLQYTGFDEPREISRLLRGPFSGLADVVLASPYLAATLSIVLISLLGWGTGIALNVNRYYNFRLWREDDKLHYRRGLLTLSEGTIPIPKVQALILRANPLMRHFGWYVLELQTMGVEGQYHQVAVPFARKDEIVALAQHVRSFVLPETFAPVSKLTIRRATIRYTVALGLIVGLVGTIAALFMAGRSFWQPVLWGFVLWPFVPAYAFLRYRNMGYASQGDHFFVRRGVFRHRIWLLPTEKQQVFYTSASLFQRRLGLKSLYVDTAGASGLAHPDVVDLPAHTADRQLGQLYRRFQAPFEHHITEKNAGRPAVPRRLR